MHSAYASDPANQQPLNRSNSATSSFFNRFTVTGKSANKRGSITSTSLSALPSGGPPATLPAAYSADPLYRDKPLPSPAYAPPSYAHAAPYGVPHPDPNSTYAFAEKRPAIAVSEPELRRTFEGILTKLKVTGKTRTQVIEMFSRTNFENKIAIVEKYKDQLAASGIRPISPPPIRQSPMPPVSPTTSVSNPELMRPVAALRDPDYAPVGVSAGRRPSISTETHDWVDRLNGGELDKQLDRVLHGMRITGYARSTVMNSTPVSGKRTMIRQYYEKTKLPPPKDVLDDLERATTPSSPRSPTPSSPRLSAFELFPPTGGDGIAPKASEYYVTLFMDNSTSPKNLLRAVTALRVQLTLNPAPAFLQEFVSSKIYVQSAGGITVTGIEALHHLLSRYNAKAQPQSLQQETAAIKVIKQRYTDASTVQPDEMRVQMLECLAKVPLESLIATEGIISTVVAVLGSTFIVEGTSLAENLALRVHAADLLGRICIDGGDTEGYTLVVNALSKAGGAVDGGELLGEIVASLVEPFVPLVGLRAKSVKRMPDRDPSTSYDVEQSIVWQFRAAVLEMVLGVVGASEDVKERVRMRKVVEAVGFKVVLEGLKNWIESAPGQEGSGSEEKGQVLEVMDLYLEAKGDDLEEFGEVEISKLSNDLVSRSPEEIVTALLASFKSLPANQQLTATLILQHVYSLIVAGNQVQSDGHHISPVELLSLTERLTSLAAQTASPTATLTSTDTQGHWTAFTDSNLSAIEAIAGFRISTGKAVPSTVAEIGTADEVGSNATSNARLAKELEELRVQYALSQSIQDDLTQEVVDLKEYISGRMENATHSGDQAVKSAQDEVRRLRDLVAGLTKERDEAVRIAESAVASASMGEENGLVSTTPEGRLRGRETVAITLDKLDLPLSDQSMKSGQN
ncbi:hypothetical protein BC830DRAFT_449981 [Chytriomyces sp. MP71]|nr:hypothetical protein BC830DRAFT_449981 [Chytriomyces sp. MP71]